jgi:hypothetical protein
MVPTVSLNDITDLPNVQLKWSHLKCLLHVPLPEETQVSPLLTTWTLGVLLSQIFEWGWIGFDLLEELLDVLEGLGLSAGNCNVAETVERSTWLFVLLQDVCAVDWHFKINLNTKTQLIYICQLEHNHLNYYD